MTWVPLGDPAVRTRWTVTHSGNTYAVFEQAGQYVVVDALCPHKKGTLVEGFVRDGAVVCPSHWYSFDLATGRCRTDDRYHLGRYAVITEGGILLADLPERAKLWWPSWLRAHAAPKSADHPE
ncbi:MAG: Rieske (2Fe-2S) protein [Jatrophihabitantaceae bacterium]